MDRRDELLRSLRLPEYEAWFVELFGKQAGARAATEYKPFHDDIGLLVAVLGGLNNRKQTEIEVSRLDDPDDSNAVQYQSAVLSRMKQRTPLYSVRFLGQSREKLVPPVVIRSRR